jgi:hypothetical protein
MFLTQHNILLDKLNPNESLFQSGEAVVLQLNASEFKSASIVVFCHSLLDRKSLEGFTTQSNIGFDKLNTGRSRSQAR